MTPLSIKHVPASCSEIFGREAEINQLREFVAKYPAKKKAVLLCGPCGSGKTTAVVALAKELNFELFEINASDVRNKDQLQAILLPAVTQKSFFYEGKIILVDEADGMSGTYDRGGVPELVSIIEKSAFPVIVTANDLVDKLKPLVKISTTITFDPLPTKVVCEILACIVTKEKINVSADVLFSLALQSDGDVRAAINDLQLLSVRQPIVKEHVEVLTQRRRTMEMAFALRTVFKTTDLSISREAFETVDEDIDEQMLWIDYNLPHEYTEAGDLVRAYGCLSKADVYRRRIQRNQEWHFLVYIGALLTAGISTAKERVYKNQVEYKQTSRLLKIWQMNMSNAKRKIIAHKFAQATHCSDKRAFSQVEYLKLMLSDKEKGEKIIAELKLDEEEVEWLRRK